MFMAVLETRNFTFEGFGKSENDAVKALSRAIDAHTAEYRISSSEFKDAYPRNCWNVREIKIGVGYRDREKITL